MKPTATDQKLRGGYYTPQRIAAFLAGWAITAASSSVLEPSCGDGEIIAACAQALLNNGGAADAIPELLHGVELNSAEADKAAHRLAAVVGASCDVSIHRGDFFAYAKKLVSSGQRFDAIVGNPPFIRYQNFPEECRQVAFYLMQSAGLHPNRLTNMWVPFLVASSLLLGENGRLAMVIPAELLQVNYAAELRYFLGTYYSRVTLVTFKKLVFEGIQQEVVLLLAERNGQEHKGIRTIELVDMSDLETFDHTDVVRSALKEMDHSTEKWTMYFLDEDELDLLRRIREHPKLTLSGYVLDVDVGIVTGLNEFFVLPRHAVAAYGLESYTVPLIGRSAHLAGTALSVADWTTTMEQEAPTYLLVLPDVAPHKLPAAVREYVRMGEGKGVHTGYKCRIRKHWYTVPSVWTPHGFMLRQVHSYPKVVVNEAGATCTDTVHRVRARNGVPIGSVAAAFLNSLTFAFAEITGRSYGGGVLELEPNEAERLPLPLEGAGELALSEFDALLRAGEIERVLDITDTVLLQQRLGLSAHETRMLRRIWMKLRDRRINRKYAAPARERKAAKLAEIAHSA